VADETADELLERAEKALRGLSKACLVVAPTLRQPYQDAPDTSPWKRFVHDPASTAYDLAHEIRRHLATTHREEAP
jgi:hypothetical protein